jgi:hypothetical protein
MGPLKDEGAPSPKQRVGLPSCRAESRHGTGIGLLEPRQHAQQGRFSRPVGAEDSEDLSAAHIHLVH